MSLAKDLILQEAQKAKNKHYSAIKEIEAEPLSGAIKAFFQQNILPMLAQLGFDRKISGNIFRISGSSWASMRNTSIPQRKLYATFLRDIRRIRNDLVSADEKRGLNISTSSKEEHWTLDDIARNQATMDAMIRDLDSIPVSWIILPRAYKFLTNEDSLCLPVYLKQLNEETNLTFRKTLTRILIEYIGNYSLKFISSNLPQKLMKDAVFYGYATMFWKNLQKPPPGLEDMLISKSFLSWAKAFIKRENCCDKEKEMTVSHMESIQNTILPDGNMPPFRQKKEIDPYLLHFTLRHGRPGINHAVQYFTMNRALSINKGNYAVYKKLPKRISSFLRILRHNYANEDARAKEFIQTFLTELNNVYTHHNLRQNLSEQHIPFDLIFAHRRMTSIVRDFNRFVH